MPWKVSSQIAVVLLVPHSSLCAAKQPIPIARISMLLGLIEKPYTVNRSASKSKTLAAQGRPSAFPLDLAAVDACDKQFKALVAAHKSKLTVDAAGFVNVQQAIRVASDALWSRLSTGYSKDKPHLQFLHSLFEGKKGQLDCFGIGAASPLHLLLMLPLLAQPLARWRSATSSVWATWCI